MDLEADRIECAEGGHSEGEGEGGGGGGAEPEDECGMNSEPEDECEMEEEEGVCSEENMEDIETEALNLDLAQNAFEENIDYYAERARQQRNRKQKFEETP